MARLRRPVGDVRPGLGLGVDERSWTMINTLYISLLFVFTSSTLRQAHLKRTRGALHGLQQQILTQLELDV